MEMGRLVCVFWIFYLRKCKMILSVIIPVYNVARYLEECVLSFINQKVDSTLYEIIIINDGSTDTSLEIAYSLMQAHPNIKVVSKENGGVASARNCGFELAQGEYVFFFDADDIAMKDSFAPLLDYLKESEVDILLIKQLRVDERLNMLPLNETEKYYFSSSFISSCTNGSILNSILLLDFPYQQILNKAFLLENKILFDKNISTFEDVLFAVQIYRYAKRIEFFDTPVYLYRYNSESVTKHDYTYLKQERDLNNLLYVLSFIRKMREEDSFISTSLSLRFYTMLLFGNMSFSFKKKMLNNRYKLSFLFILKELRIAKEYLNSHKLLVILFIYCIYRISPVYNYLALRRTIRS